MAITREILNSHPVSTLKKEVAKTNIKGYSKMKKAEVVELMMKNKDKFGHIRKKGEASAPASKPKKPSGKAKETKKPESKISDETALGMAEEIREEIRDSYDTDEDLPEDFKKLRDKFELNVPFRGMGRFDKKSKGKMEYDNLKLEMAKAIKPTAKTIPSKKIGVLVEAVKKKGLLKGELLKKWNNWKKEINKAYKEIEPFFIVDGKFK